MILIFTAEPILPALRAYCNPPVMPLPLVLSSIAELIGSTAPNKLTEVGVDQLLRAPWQDNNPNSKRKVERGLEKRFLLSSDVKDYKRRPHYARSPIMKYTRERCTCPGTVYVAYVPPRMGKTTACVAHIEMYGQNGGLCFSPAAADSGKPCLQNILALLDLKDYAKPPSGLGDLIARKLASPAGVRPTSYLLLDEFMPKGINSIDEDLARTIKTVVRKRN